MKKTIYFLVSVLYSLVISYASIAQNAPVTTIASSQVCPDSAVTLPVTVINFTGIASISLRIDFDPTQLTYVSATNANPSLPGLLINVVTVNANLKKIMVVWADITPVTLSNGSKLFDLNFTYLNGTASLAFNNTSNGGSDCEFADENGDPLNDIPTGTYYIDGQVTSNAIGAAGTISGTSTVCAGTQGVAFSVPAITNATGYVWSLPNGATIASGNNTNSITVNFSASSSSGNITVYGTNSCGNGTISPDFPVTVNPLPSVTNSPLAQDQCSGTNTGIHLTGSITGTTFAWTAAGSSANITGYSSGSGSTISQTLVNTGTATETVTYTITPTANGCAGPSSDYVVTVFPVPDLSNSPANQSQCNNIATNITLLSNVSGTTFTWTCTASSLNISGYSDNTSPSTTLNQVLFNSGYDIETVTYHITPSANGCSGTLSDYVVTVYPTPDLSNTPLSQDQCNNMATGITLTSNISGTTFTWTATASSPNVTGFSNNSSSTTTLNQTLTNSGFVVETVTYHITPSANGCSGLPVDYVVTVYPTPDLSNTPLSQAQCNNLATDITLSSNVTGTTFTWTATASSPNISGFSNGSGSSINQTLTNSGSVTDTVTYQITPSANGCDGTTTDYIVSVYPTPVVTTTPLYDTICTMTATWVVLTSSFPGTSFAWTASATSTYLTGYSSGSGTSIIQVLANYGSAFDTVIYQITPIANACTGPVTNYYMTVHPLPSAAGTISGDTLVEQNQTGVPYSIPSVTNATGYAWTLPSGATIASGDNTNSITVDYSASASSGNISVHGTNLCGDGPESPLLAILVGFTIQGIFVYNNIAQTPLDSLWITLKQNDIPIDSTRTTLTGSYSFTGKPNGTYTLHAITQKPWSGINGTDALKVQRHFVGLEPLSTPIRITAADVNNSNSVNGTDALKIKRRFVGLDTSFARGNWTFEKTDGGDTIIINGAHIIQDFYGLCVGDVNGSNIPGPGEKSGGMVYIASEGELESQPGSRVTIPFMVSRDMVVGAVSLTLEYPSESFQVNDVIFSQGTPLFQAENGRLALVWAETTPLELKAGELLFSISGTILPNFVPGDGFTFRAEDPSEIADATGESLGNVDLLSPRITYPGDVPNSHKAHLIDRIWIYPNPAQGEVFVEFNLLLSSELTVQILDAMGCVMNSSIFSLEEGSHHLKFATETLSPGLYMVKFQASSGTLREVHFSKLIKN